MIIEKIKAKSLIKKSNVDDYWWSEASLNPYRGCYHDCKYCDGKSPGYYIHDDFANRIKGKTNSVELLEKFFSKFSQNKSSTTLNNYFSQLRNAQIPKSSEKFIISVGGGVCDVYQPCESEMKITKGILDTIYKYKFPVMILTKSKLVLRDIELLKKINEVSYANVAFSITLAKDETQKIVEPRASTTTERFEAIKQLKKEGIHSGVLFMPIQPWLSDTHENIDRIFSKAHSSNAEYVVMGGLTLKPGKNKDEYLTMIKENFPQLLEKYQLFYGNNNKYGMPNYAKARRLGIVDFLLEGYNISKKYNLPIRMPRYLPKGRIETNLRLSTMLFKLAYLKAHIIRPIWPFVGEFRKAAIFIDSYTRDITTLKENEIEILPITKKVKPYVLEYINEGKISFLESLDEDKDLFVN